MSQEFVLKRDIVYDHNERMLNIRKYYPYFKLIESTFTQYKEGRYQELDMGYIMMAVLRFFIEENNFKEKNVTYQEFKDFVSEIIRKDFELNIPQDEENELIGYIFDKIKNDGKPFIYEYFDPSVKKKKSVRVKLIEDKLENDMVVYTITSDAIEFYLDTKEIKDESTITTSQLLLGKLIASKNFKGGTEVVKRINNEVSRLISKQNEVLNLLSVDIFEGVKSFEEFQSTGMKWFEEEQKLFVKNRELIEKTLRQGEAEGKYHDAMEDIYVLEAELNKAMTRHSDLLTACTSLQVKADEIVTAAKFVKLRTTMDFKNTLNRLMEEDRADILELMIAPAFGLHPKRLWNLTAIDDMLNCRTDKEEKGEIIKDVAEDRNYVYPDELEEQRIANNYAIFLDALFEMLNEKEEFSLSEYSAYLSELIGDISRNGDYYSFMIHLCQKECYDVKEVLDKPDTFLEENIKGFVEEHGKYEKMVFEIDRTGMENVLNPVDDYMMSDVTFRKL